VSSRFSCPRATEWSCRSAQFLDLLLRLGSGNLTGMATQVEAPAAISAVTPVDNEIEELLRPLERRRANLETVAVGWERLLRPDIFRPARRSSHALGGSKLSAIHPAVRPTRGYFAVPWLQILVVFLLAAIVRTAPVFALPDETPRPTPGQSLEIRLRPLPAGVDRISLEPDGEGGHWYVLEMVDGSKERERPRGLAERIWTENRDRRWYFTILNITSPIGMAWVVLGLLAQVVFMGRMVAQWVTSERLGRSVVPVAFWWMSLAGASMLLTYFVWRRDIVGILGQSAGWIIYSRNLWMIYRERLTGGGERPGYSLDR